MVHSLSEKEDAAPTMKLGRMVARGATFQFLAQFGSRIISIVGAVILIRLLVSPAVYALITLAVTVPGVVMIGNITGVNVALTKYLSEYRGQRNSDAIWSSFWSAITVKAITGLALSLTAYFAAGPISEFVGVHGELAYFQIAAPLPLVWVTSISIKSTLLSLDRSLAYSILKVVNEVLLSAIPIIAVLLGFGALGALEGMVIGNYVYLCIALGFSIAVVVAETRRGERHFTFRPTVKKLLSFGLPLGFSNSFSTFAGQVVNLVVARSVSLDVFGLYSVAQSASGFLNYISDPITSMLLPAFSRTGFKQTRDDMQRLSDQTTRYLTVFVLPVALFFAIFAKPVVIVLFGPNYAGAGLLLTVISLAVMNVGLARDALKTFLTSRGFSTFAGLLGILGSSVNIVFALVAVPSVGLLWYLVIDLLGFVPGYILLVRKTRAELGLRPPYRAILPFYYAAAISVALLTPLALLNVPPLLLLMTGLIGTPATYVFFSVLFHAITLSDSRHLREMLAPQPLISAATGPFISLIEIVIRFVQ